MSALPSLAVTFGQEGGMRHGSRDVSPPAAWLGDDGVVYVSWIEEEAGKNSVYFALSQDGGKTFSPSPGGLRVNSALDEPSGTHESPAMALGTEGEIYVLWKARGKDASTGDIRLGRSTDGGKTFSPSVRVNDNDGPSSVGFESMAVGPDGAVHVAWLDGRLKGDGGNMTSVFSARSVDGGKTFAENTLVDKGACPCCRTALAVSPDGRVYVSWRKVYEGDIREVVVASSIDAKAFSAPMVVGNDRWEIAGCPHRGPSMGIAADQRLFVGWYSEAGGEPGIYIAESSDHAKTFAKSRIAVGPAAFPDHPAIALSGRRLFAAWEEVTPVLSSVVFEEQGAGGADRQKLNRDMRKATFPLIRTNARGDVLVAWLKLEFGFARTVIVIGR